MHDDYSRNIKQFKPDHMKTYQYGCPFPDEHMLIYMPYNKLGSIADLKETELMFKVMELPFYYKDGACDSFNLHRYGHGKDGWAILFPELFPLQAKEEPAKAGYEKITFLDVCLTMLSLISYGVILLCVWLFSRATRQTNMWWFGWAFTLSIALHIKPINTSFFEKLFRNAKKWWNAK